MKEQEFEKRNDYVKQVKKIEFNTQLPKIQQVNREKGVKAKKCLLDLDNGSPAENNPQINATSCVNGETPTPVDIQLETWLENYKKFKSKCWRHGLVDVKEIVLLYDIF